MLNVKNITNFLDTVAPPRLACAGDRIGLQIGDPSAPVQRILVTLDVTPEVIRKAVSKKVQLIISHHPLIFNPLEKIDFQHPLGAMIQILIKRDIAVFILHTNLDIAEGGVNDVLAEQYGLTPSKCEPLEVTQREPLYKLTVFVPGDYLESVRQAMGDAGAGHIGNYSHCTFATAGEGTFLGLEGTSPFIGKTGVLERVHEKRVETIVPETKLEAVLSAMRTAHPYEEVAYDVYALHQTGKAYGLGRVGVTKKGERIAVCCGSGGKWMAKASAMGAKRYVVGEAGYHDLLEARARGLTVDVLGHKESEQGIVPVLVAKIKKAFPRLANVSTQ